MKVFIAGVMQGNRKDAKIHSQNYRKEIIEILTRLNTSLEVVDPDIIDPDRFNYTDEQGAEMFFRYNFMVKNVDLLISYVPEASMGTAIEMWEAWKNKIPVITISPLTYNWAVKLLSSKIYPSIEEFAKAFREGELKIFLKKISDSSRFFI